jgi:hypothetical protein
MANVNETIIEIEAGDVDEEEAKEIYRNLQVLYGTIAGEQALDREFGIDTDIPDVPQEDARELLAAEYIAKTQRYEPRAEVNSVEWVEGDPEKGNMIPKVVIEIV